MTIHKLKPSRGSYFVCVDCTADDVDLLVGKLYKIAKPEKNDPPSMIRIIDESREDYLYPIEWFEPVEVPARAKRMLAAAVA